MLRGNRRKVTFRPHGQIDTLRCLSSLQVIHEQFKNYQRSELKKIRKILASRIKRKRHRVRERALKQIYQQVMTECVDAIIFVSRAIIETEVKRSRSFLERKLKKILNLIPDQKEIRVCSPSKGILEIQTKAGKIFYNWEAEFELLTKKLLEQSTDPVASC